MATNSEEQYQKTKASLLAEEHKLIQLLSAMDFLRRIREAREHIFQRIENDESTLTQRDLMLSFSSNQIDPLTWRKIRDQDGRCAPLRNEWYALLQTKNKPSN